MSQQVTSQTDQSDVQVKQGNTMKALSISGLQKQYGSGHQALKGVDLTVEPGDFFALLGPNGAGKSTIIGIISSLVSKSAGQVDVFGYDIDTDFSGAKNQLGVVPQEFNFNQFEKVQDILVTQAGYYGIEAKDAVKRAEKYLKQLGLWDKRFDQSRNLSGGMKRRLMIARALMHEPRLLILDEPTAGVDIELRRSMWEFLTEINEQGTTIILTTHYLEEAENLCRNIAIIDQGNIIEHCSMRELLSQLQRETLVLDLADDVSDKPTLDGFDVKLVGGHQLEVEIEQGQALNDVFLALEKQNISVVSMRNKSNRLEELFVKLLEDNK